MNNFFEKALAIKRRYCQAAIELGTDIYGPGYDVDTFNPYKDAKVEILSRLVATYFMYDGNIPNKFSIKLSDSYDTDWLLCTLQAVFKI